jgi:hypothetical protein
LARGVTTSDVRCIALLDVADYALFLCLAISSRTLGTSFFGTPMIVPEEFPARGEFALLHRRILRLRRR